MLQELQEPVLLRAVQGLLGEEETNKKLVLALTGSPPLALLSV